MPKIIKAHLVNIDEGFHPIEVPEKSDFAGVNADFSDTDELSEDFSDYPDDIEEQYEVQKTPEELLEEASNSASQILEEARNAAANIIENAMNEARAEADALFEDAKIKGYEKGLEEGAAAGKRIVEDANRTLQEAHEEKAAILNQIEPDAVSLVIKIVEKLVGDFITLNPAIIFHLIRVGLEGAPAAKELAVRVSNTEYDKAFELKDELFNYVDSDTRIAIIKDNSLLSGDCVIDTPVGSINSSISTQWDALKQDLLQLLKASAP